MSEMEKLLFAELSEIKTRLAKIEQRVYMILGGMITVQVLLQIADKFPHK